MADILVADDTRSIRSALSLLLEEEGHTVRLASDGESALAEYRRRRPDLLLLDVMMPRKNGYQVLKQIRKEDPALPVMILSGAFMGFITGILLRVVLPYLQNADKTIK